MRDSASVLPLLISHGWIERGQKLSCFVLLLSLKVDVFTLKNQSCCRFEIIANNSIMINSKILILGAMSKMQTSASRLVYCGWIEQEIEWVVLYLL
ncbi:MULTISPECIES: hypothetical protein [unclassified Bartonella]|uniref:hypothetical protein n=1 Tax=Bartonella TaxID=773 RepID=UPI0035D0A9A3